MHKRSLRTKVLSRIKLSLLKYHSTPLFRASRPTCKVGSICTKKLVKERVSGHTNSKKNHHLKQGLTVPCHTQVSHLQPLAISLRHYFLILPFSLGLSQSFNSDVNTFCS